MIDDGDEDEVVACILSWAANAIAFWATVNIASGYPLEGFCKLLIANILFILYGMKSKRRAFVVFNILWFFNSIYGIHTWKSM